MKSYLLVILMTSFIACNAQDKKHEDHDHDHEEKAKTEHSQGDAKSKAQALLDKKYGNTGDVKWEMDDEGNLEGHFEHDGEDLRADFTKEGDWKETEISVDWDDLPEVLQEAIKSEYDKDDISEIEFVDHHTKGEFYDVEFKKKGKNMDVEYKASGEKL